MEISCRLAILHTEYIISEKAVSFAFKVHTPPLLLPLPYVLDFSHTAPLLETATRPHHCEGFDVLEYHNPNIISRLLEYHANI